MFYVDERGYAAFFLRFRHRVERNGGFTSGFGTVYLNNSSLGKSAYSQRQIESERAGGYGFNVQLGFLVSHYHYGAFAEGFYYVGNRGIKGFLFFFGCVGFYEYFFRSVGG